MRYREFHWLHTPSGQTGVKPFTTDHSPDADLTGGVSEIVALRFVNRWNNGSTDWKYWV